MMGEETYHAIFDRYLKGELTEQELAAFEQQLLTDTDFRESFDMYNVLVEGIRDSRKEELRQYLREHKATRKPLPAKNLLMNWYWAAAATIVLVAGVYLVVQHQAPFAGQPEIADRQAAPPPVPENKIDTGTLSTGGEAPVPPATQETTESPAVTENEPEGEMTDIQEIHPSVTDEKVSAGQENKGVQPPIPEKNPMTDDFMEVKKDRLLADTVLQVLLVKENTAGRGEADTATRRGKISITPPAAQVKLEFWQSPINYRGYKFDGKKLILYGMNTWSGIQVKALLVNEDLEVWQHYLYLQGDHYPLQDDNTFRNLHKVADKQLLNILKN